VSTPVSSACPACGTVSTGRFCEQCGTALSGPSCAGCGAGLTPGARFCHRCGRPVDGAATDWRRERLPWFVAGILIISGLSWIAFKGINRNAPGAPDMANVGSAGSQQGAPAAGGPPDISTMSPAERFNRLYDRIMRAASAGNTAEARQFLPMALMAYSQLDTLNADLRYHAAVLNIEGERYPAALAIADTILRENPNHLFAYLIRAETADHQGDAAAARAARQAFDSVYAAEITRTDRPEYAEHKAVIEQFKASTP